jgi:hypothetical protein
LIDFAIRFKEVEMIWAKQGVDGGRERVLRERIGVEKTFESESERNKDNPVGVNFRNERDLFAKLD